MQPLLQIQAENDQLQQLTLRDGPTAIAFHYVQLKVLVWAFIRSDPAREIYLQVWAMLENECRVDLVNIIDRYDQLSRQSQLRLATQTYYEAHQQLKDKINLAVSMLSHQ